MWLSASPKRHEGAWGVRALVISDFGSFPSRTGPSRTGPLHTGKYFALPGVVVILDSGFRALCGCRLGLLEHNEAAVPQANDPNLKFAAPGIWAGSELQVQECH